MAAVARRHQALTVEIAQAGHLVGDALPEQRPADFLARRGLGTGSGAMLLVSAADNPAQLRTEASFAPRAQPAPGGLRLCKGVGGPIWRDHRESDLRRKSSSRSTGLLAILVLGPLTAARREPGVRFIDPGHRCEIRRNMLRAARSEHGKGHSGRVAGGDRDGEPQPGLDA